MSSGGPSACIAGLHSAYVPICLHFCVMYALRADTAPTRSSADVRPSFWVHGRGHDVGCRPHSSFLSGSLCRSTGCSVKASNRRLGSLGDVVVRKTVTSCTRRVCHDGFTVCIQETRCTIEIMVNRAESRASAPHAPCFPCVHRSNSGADELDRRPKRRTAIGPDRLIGGDSGRPSCPSARQGAAGDQFDGRRHGAGL